MIRNPFSILRGGAEAPAPDTRPGHGVAENPSDRIARMVTSSDIFVLMKGSPKAPRCGFSANTVSIISSLGVPFSTFDVLADEQIRSEAKRYADWPTFPQVYVHGEFVGGVDIITQMHASGDLRRLAEERCS